MIRATFTFCRIDGKPIDRSPPYKIIRRLLGQTIADKLTYEITVPADDDDCTT